MEEEAFRLTDENAQIIRSLGISDYKEAERMVKEHIERLHRYNEYKDTAQMLIGKLAILEGTTTRELYPRFDLDLDD